MLKSVKIKHFTLLTFILEPMKSNKIYTIITLVTISVILLITVQIFWITNVIKIENEKFERNVHEALVDFSKQIDKKEVFNVVTSKFTMNGANFFFASHGDSSTFSFSSTDKDGSSSGFGTFDKNATVKVEVNVDNDTSITNQNFVIVPPGDSAKIFYTSIIKNRTKIVEDVVDEIFFAPNTATLKERIANIEFDSLLTKELADRGIKTRFDFGVIAGSDDSLIFISDGVPEHELRNTNFKVRIFGDDIVTKPDYLLLNFPEKNRYIVSSVIGLLLLSIFLILVISYLFYITIKMLLKQKRLTEIKNDLINNITHEFKTPISTIQLACEALNEPQLATDLNTAKRYTSIINDENNRLKHMVDDILATASLEKGEYNLKKEFCDINLLINDVRNYYSEKLKDRGGEITINPGCTNYIHGDKFHLKNIISNLVDNSIKYCKKNPEIVIATSDKNGGVEISVKDNGIGIPKKETGKIFDSFYRVPTGNLHDVKGHGIGLSYVKKIVTIHGGKISLESKPEKGSEFIIYLPGKNE